MARGAGVADEGGTGEVGRGDHGVEVAPDRDVGLAAEVAATALAGLGAAGEAGEEQVLAAARASDALGEVADLAVGLLAEDALQDGIESGVVGAASVFEGVPGGAAHADVAVLEQPVERFPNGFDPAADVAGAEVLGGDKALFGVAAARQRQQLFDLFAAHTPLTDTVGGFLMPVHAGGLSHCRSSLSGLSAKS